MKIALLGDIALFGKNSATDKSYLDRFSPIRELLKKYDYVVGNLETPLTDYNRPVGGKSAYLKGDPQNVEILQYLGITHVSLANNHSFDYRKNGLEDTIMCLNEAGIRWVGADRKYECMKDDNTTVILRGYCCYSTNAKGLRTGRPSVDVLDPTIIEKDLESAENKKAFSILSCHWGIEHVHLPSPDHIKMVRRLARGRSAVFYGHHPHVIQGIETIGESMAAYSLGNFCFDDVYTPKSEQPLIKLSQDNQESFVLGLEIEGNTIKSYKIIPFSFAGGVYKIREEICPKIQLWSEMLSLPMDEIAANREKELSKYLKGRKQLRDLNWYLKRMNFESVKMILNAVSDQHQYDSLIKSYIED